MKRNMINKKQYSSPQIQIIELDNDISLSMDSNPPTGNGENQTSLMWNIQNDPYKNQIG
jgi:hypothetical protein